MFHPCAEPCATHILWGPELTLQSPPQWVIDAAYRRRRSWEGDRAKMHAQCIRRRGTDRKRAALWWGLNSLICSRIVFPSKNSVDQTVALWRSPQELKSNRLTYRSETVLGLHATIRIQSPLSFVHVKINTGPCVIRRPPCVELSCLLTLTGVLVNRTLTCM